MKDFSKATPRPWRLETAPRGWGDRTVMFGSGRSDDHNNHVLNDLYPIEQTRINYELIVTAVNNFDKMKEAIETQLQIIEALISSKRIVNLDESIAYYKQLLESLK